MRDGILKPAAFHAPGLNDYVRTNIANFIPILDFVNLPTETKVKADLQRLQERSHSHEKVLIRSAGVAEYLFKRICAIECAVEMLQRSLNKNQEHAQSTRKQQGTVEHEAKKTPTKSKAPNQQVKPATEQTKEANRTQKSRASMYSDNRSRTGSGTSASSTGMCRSGPRSAGSNSTTWSPTRLGTETTFIDHMLMLAGQTSTLIYLALISIFQAHGPTGRKTDAPNLKS